MTLLSGPEISGPHNDVGEIVRSWSGPETPANQMKLDSQEIRPMRKKMGPFYFELAILCLFLAASQVSHETAGKFG